MTERLERSSVYVIKTNDRKLGVRRLLERCLLEDFAGRDMAVKANYNSADTFPASTDLETLATIIDVLRSRKVSRITVAERSGMGVTREVLETMGVADLAKKEGIELVALDEMDDLRHWQRYQVEGFHWRHGFLFSRIFEDADGIVETCCLKTHRFGGHFTMSLKNSVGMVARLDPESSYDYMRELHSSRYQRQMIAEINAAYKPALVIMDAIKGFSHGGPERGTLVEPGVLLASADRVALDAAGVAMLRSYGTTSDVSKGSVFEQAQIARAVELGLGAAGPEEMEVVPLNDDARAMCSRIEKELRGAAKAEMR